MLIKRMNNNNNNVTINKLSCCFCCCKRMKLIRWSIISLNICYLFLCEGRQNYDNKKNKNLLIVSKRVLVPKEGSRGRPRGSRFVLVIMCVWATPGMPKSYLSPTFDQDIDVQSFEIIFLTPNRPNEKTSRKQKSLAWYLSLIIIFQKIKHISRKVLLNCFMTKSGQTVFSP